jgi:hypothetical protein
MSASLAMEVHEEHSSKGADELPKHGWVEPAWWERQSGPRRPGVS